MGKGCKPRRKPKAMDKLRRIAPFRTYTITQLCREFDCTPRALRFYEEQGLLAPGRRDIQRVYSHRDRTRVGLIVRGRRVGLSVAEIRKLFETYDDSGPGAQSALAFRLFQKRIAALEAQKLEIDAAIATLHAACARLSSRGEATQAA